MEADTLVADTPEARWLRWQRRGYLQDRRRRTYARMLAGVVLGALAVRLFMQVAATL